MTTSFARFAVAKTSASVGCARTASCNPTVQCPCHSHAIIAVTTRAASAERRSDVGERWKVVKPTAAAHVRVESFV